MFTSATTQITKCSRYLVSEYAHFPEPEPLGPADVCFLQKIASNYFPFNLKHAPRCTTAQRNMDLKSFLQKCASGYILDQLASRIRCTSQNIFFKIIMAVILRQYPFWLHFQTALLLAKSQCRRRSSGQGAEKRLLQHAAGADIPIGESNTSNYRHCFFPSYFKYSRLSPIHTRLRGRTAISISFCNCVLYSSYALIYGSTFILVLVLCGQGPIFLIH